MDYSRPSTLSDALALLAAHSEAMALAGGQSLLPAMQLGFAAPARLVDLQDLVELHGVRGGADGVWIGAMTSHSQIACDRLIVANWPMLAHVARGIADAQVRAVGTIGGAVANNDPAACWPAALLAARAMIQTSRREIAATDFFTGLFSTALEAGELITSITFPKIRRGAYLKFEQAASRFALVGVAVAQRLDGGVGVAITGLGNGVYRWHEAEALLSRNLEAQALAPLRLDPALASDDIHADASYRAHLAKVLLYRVVSELSGGT